MSGNTEMSTQDRLYADLAAAIMAAARELRAHTHHDPSIARLSYTEVNVMRYIDRNPGASPSAVAEGTGLQRSNVSTALRALQTKGFVQRTVDAADNRQVVLRPTARAAKNLEALRASWAALIAERFDAAGATPEVEPVLRVLELLAGR